MDSINAVITGVIRWMNKHWIISSLLIWLALWKAFWWYAWTPIRNPWPKEAYTIRGRFPFDQGFELMFMQDVYGRANWHQRLCSGGLFNLFRDDASLATCSAGRVWTKPRQIDAQHYEVTLYRDVYFAGLQDWTVNTWHAQYKANAGVDYTFGIDSYGAPKNSACDDSESTLNQFNGRLLCSRQTEHKDFKNLHIAEGDSVGNHARIQNFWLDSELRQMLAKKP